jgi:MFS superfamily sulfate permease-like transporter
MTTAAAVPPSRLAPLLPATGWLRSYDRSDLGRAVVGGLAAGSVVIPQALAYTTIADLPAQVGLYTRMVPMVVYVLLGGSRTLSVSRPSSSRAMCGAGSPTSRRRP